MGKSSKPLHLVIEPSLDGPTFDKLREQGYLISHIQSDPDAGPDGYLGPRCWRMDPEVASNPKLLEAAIKQMRAVRYGMENKKAYKREDPAKPAKASKGRPRKSSKSSPVSTGDSDGGETVEAAVPCEASHAGGHAEPQQAGG